MDRCEDADSIEVFDAFLICGRGYESLTVIMLKLRLSTQKHNRKHFIGAEKTTAAHLELDGLMTPTKICFLTSKSLSSIVYGPARFGANSNVLVSYTRLM